MHVAKKKKKKNLPMDQMDEKYFQIEYHVQDDIMSDSDRGM